MRKEIPLHEAFTKIRVKDVGRLILTQGDQPGLAIEADQAAFSDLIAEVRGDSLTLGFEHDSISQLGKLFSSLINRPERDVTYTLTVQDIDQIYLSGKLDLDCAAFQTNRLGIHVSGLSQLDLARLECDSLDVGISGRGVLTAAGRAEHQSVKISGSGDYQAPHLASRSLRIVISGQGEATVQVEEELDITISGIGTVNYYGHPKLRQVISGVGKTKRLNDQ